MSLEPGSKLGHYEIVSSLGAGGMGEVYRARDTKLGREVAIKLLLDEVSSDPERVARFDREARVLASLSHKNIATLHGFFRATPVPGAGPGRSLESPRAASPESEQEGDTSFLVMELVEGETLAERIARGRVPVDESIRLFIEIAAGLEAAHEKGIVHRDLKPANIKLSARGEVKILDFGRVGWRPAPHRRLRRRDRGPDQARASGDLRPRSARGPTGQERPVLDLGRTDRPCRPDA